MEWLVWRLVKFVGVSLFAGGLAGSRLAKGSDRLMFAHRLAPLGLFLTWVGGYALMKLSGRSLGEAWLSASLWGSLLAYHGALASGRREGEVAGSPADLGFLAVLVLMVFKPMSPWAWVGAALPLVLAVGGWVTRGEPEVSAEDRAETLGWFKVVARLEGLSLLFLFGVYMPLKHGAGIVLDGGMGLVGWIHGALFLIYIPSLFHAGRMLGWSWGRVAVGAVAANLPFGTFIFERRLKS